MAGFDTSASQRRAMTVLGIAFDVNDSHETASRKLEAVNVPGDGIPFGHDWRSAKKLSDPDLVAELKNTKRILDEASEILGDYAETMR